MAVADDNLINVSTLNVKGLLNIHCQYALKQFTLLHKVNILFLQETHVYNIKTAKVLENYFDHFKCFWSFGDKYSRGTAIFISHSLDYNIVKYHRDLDGRFQFVDVSIDNVLYRLINIYAPNNKVERKDFFDDIYPFLITRNVKIFGGDFNCIENLKLDKIGGNNEKGYEGIEKIKDIVKDFDLFDVYRFLYPNRINCTWHGSKIACRLDRFYFCNKLKDSVKYCNVIPFSNSDHDCVMVSFVNNTEVKKGHGYWHLNNSVLNDKAFCISFRKWFLNLIDGLDICIDVWDHLKGQIKEFCINYCKKKSRVKYKVIRELEKKYFSLLHLERSNPGNYFEQVKDLKLQIKEFYLNDFKGSQIRSKVKLLDNSEVPSKYFFKKEVKNGKKKIITEIRNNNVVYKNNDNIMNEFVKFYTDLFSNEEIDDDVMDFFLKDLPELSDIDKNLCEVPITIEEISESLCSMQNDKSPGPDGLSKNFYVCFFDILGPILFKLYENIFDENTLSDSQKLSYITLICKDSSKHFDVKAYRPISLMNYDVKILSKLICRRMGLVIDNLIDVDQTCAIKGRSILDNGHLFRNIIDYVNQKKLKCSFISLDQEKAFDKIIHRFLFHVLEKYNFGPNLIKWIKILYNDLKSSVIVNNFISDPININRSVKQGCSLSPLLYILCLEPFARKVRNDKDIKGIKLPGSPDEIKISLFADDSTGVLTTDYSIHKFLYWINLFGKASGSKLNKDKTKGLWLGEWKNRKDNYRFGIDFVDSLKIVGIRFGNNVSQDDIWNPILLKFEKKLDEWKNRKLSLLERCIIINLVACSKIWYVGSVMYMSKYYVSRFQKLVFKFLWNIKSEPLARDTVYLSKQLGGLNVINIELKLQALRLRHVQNIINNKDVKFVKFSIYWIGFSLRNYQPVFASVSIPHSDVLPPFYRECLKVLNNFKNNNSGLELDNLSCKVIYNTLLEKVLHIPKIVHRYPFVDFKIVFKYVFDKFIDKFSRDIMFRIVHEILPVSSLMFRYNIYKSSKCIFCDNVETLKHLFFECTVVGPLFVLLKNWILAISKGMMLLDFENLSFRNISAPNKETRSIILLLISLYCKTVWLNRNDKKFKHENISASVIYINFLSQLKLRILADYERFSELKFKKFWCSTNLFCKIQNGTLDVMFL